MLHNTWRAVTWSLTPSSVTNSVSTLLVFSLYFILDWSGNTVSNRSDEAYSCSIGDRFKGEGKRLTQTSGDNYADKV